MQWCHAACTCCQTQTEDRARAPIPLVSRFLPPVAAHVSRAACVSSLLTCALHVLRVACFVVLRCARAAALRWRRGKQRRRLWTSGTVTSCATASAAASSAVTAPHASTHTAHKECTGGARGGGGKGEWERTAAERLRGRKRSAAPVPWAAFTPSDTFHNTNDTRLE